MSYTIKKLSSNGFLLSDLGWKSVDKFKVLVKPLFLDLVIGDVIDNLKFNKEGYVVDFIVLKHEDQEKEDSNHISLNISQQNSKLLSSSPVSTPSSLGRDDSEREDVLNPQNKFNSSSVQDSIRYAQCVNIAFNSLNPRNLDFMLDKKYPAIELGFNIADNLFKEFNKRCSR